MLQRKLQNDKNGILRNILVALPYKHLLGRRQTITTLNKFTKEKKDKVELKSTQLENCFKEYIVIKNLFSNQHQFHFHATEGVGVMREIINLN